MEYDSQNVGEEDAHGPAGDDWNAHRIQNVTGSFQAVFFNVIKASSNLYDDVDQHECFS